MFAGHAGLTPVPGVADIAMYLFFGLSGFLISTLLIEEHERRNAISLGRFLARRALRLLPALVAFLAVWLAVVAAFGHDSWMTTVPGGGKGAGERLVVALEGVGAALGYVTNWLGIFHVFTGYVPLGHLWSLAVEEQVYVFWAPLLALLLSWRRKWAVLVAVGLAGASTVEAIWLRAIGRGNWAYMGTDARSGAFLLGAAFALARSGGLMTFLNRRFIGPAVGGGAIAALLSCAVPLATARSLRSYGAAWSMATLAGPLIVVSVVDRASGSLVRILSHPILTYLGRRSYALYLWHYVFLTWFRDLDGTGVVLALASSLIAAELSWRAVEARALQLKERWASPPTGWRAPSSSGAASREAVLASR